jgi:hypothetical protein
MWRKAHSLSNKENLMRYLLMIVEPRGQREARGEAEARACYSEMEAFGESLGDKLLASESLRQDSHGVRVQLGASKPQLLDGPFAEAKEMVGGFYLIECADRDEALAIAQDCPGARFATVEVRECAPCYVQ